MDRFVVRPGGPLSGTVRICGATKNAGTKQMAAALLAPGITTIRNIPPVADLEVMVEVLAHVGAEVAWIGPEALTIDATELGRPEVPYALASRMRASVNLLGPLLARHGWARVAMPGGDNIGSRKLDMHFRGLEAMGATLEVRHGYIDARADVLGGTRLVLDFPSVGATENLVTAAVMARGTTVIENAAREPEVTDLAAFLNRMGARVYGAGTSTIEIDGVDALVATEGDLVGDRIEAGTFLMACGIVGGEIELEGIHISDLDMVVQKLGEMGMKVSSTPNGLWAKSDERLRAVDIATLPFPGFATDLMPQVVALLATSEGTAIVTENVFDSRFGFVDELNRMGADVRTEGRHAIVCGVPRLSGAPVRALDVRAGVALILAGLAADGVTEVLQPHHVDRWHPDVASRFRMLGADVERVCD